MSASKTTYKGLIAIGNSLQSLFLLAVRLYWGWSFMQTGLGKFKNIKQVTAFFTSLGIPMPELNAYVSASVEFLGGIFLLLGLASRIAPLFLIGTMVVAYLTADAVAVKTIFSNPKNFISAAPFTYLFASLLVFIFGPGKVSIDYLLEKTVFKTKDYPRL